MLALPATGETIFLTAAASGLIALSSANGPSSMPPVICPRSAILHSAAASIVEGTSGLTVSIALRIATSGCGTPSAWARSIAFWVMSTLVLRSGAMLTAASVMISASAWSGTSMMKQWLIRRPVRSPVSRATTADISSSVCRLPFISASARPSRTSATALRGGVDAVLGVDDLHVAEVDPELVGDGRDLVLRPDQDRADEPHLRGLDRASSEISSHGCAIARASPAAPCSWRSGPRTCRAVVLTWLLYLCGIRLRAGGVDRDRMPVAALPSCNVRAGGA